MASLVEDPPPLQRLARALLRVGVLVAIVAASLVYLADAFRSPDGAGADRDVLAQASDQGAPLDIPAIRQLFSECDAAAQYDSDAVHFSILPMVLTNRDGAGLAVAQHLDDHSYVLLSAQDALDGLRDKKLMLRAGRYTFAVVDADAGATQTWTGMTGVSRLTWKDAAAVQKLKIGFDFSEAQSGPKWSPAFRRDRRVCYWVSAVSRN